MNLSDIVNLTARPNGTTQLHDDLATLDLRRLDRLFGRVIAWTTLDENLDLAVKRLDALRWMRGRPSILVARRASLAALLTRHPLPSVSR